MGVGCQMLRFLQLFLFSSPFPASRLKNPFTVSFRVACGCLLCALFSLNLKQSKLRIAFGKGVCLGGFLGFHLSTG